MASMIERLFTLLSAGSTLAGSRVWPLTAPDTPTTPYIVYQRIFSKSDNALGGNTGLINTRVQIDCYALTYADAQTLAAQVDTLMSAWATQNLSVGATDLYESEVHLFRVTADYSIWHY